MNWPQIFLLASWGQLPSGNGLQQVTLANAGDSISTRRWSFLGRYKAVPTNRRLPATLVSRGPRPLGCALGHSFPVKPGHYVQCLGSRMQYCYDCHDAGGDERGRENRSGFAACAPDHRFGLGTLAALGRSVCLVDREAPGESLTRSRSDLLCAKFVLGPLQSMR
jgi:hypothetical protein